MLAYRQQAERENQQISVLLPRLKGRLLQVQQIEQALDNLADIKEAVDQQDRANGGPTSQSSADLKRAVERLLERADAVAFIDEALPEIDEEGADGQQS